MGLVIIPLDYDSMNNRTGIVPICIEDTDRHGRLINPAWFEAVVPIADPIRKLAKSVVGDVWCSSELAQDSLHAEWYEHGDDLGRNPTGRIYAHARWRARDLRDGGRNARRGVEVELLQSILSNLRSEVDVHSEVEFWNIIERLQAWYQAHGVEHVGEMMDMWLRECEWSEIAEHVGKKPKAAAKDFWRWFKRGLRELELL